MAGKKGRSGRRTSIVTSVGEALKENDDYLPEYLEVLRSIALDDTALKRDRIDCTIYLINRSQGSPKAQTELRVKAERIYTPEELKLMQQPLSEEAELLKEWGDIGIEHPNQTDWQAEREAISEESKPEEPT